MHWIPDLKKLIIDLNSEDYFVLIINWLAAGLSLVSLDQLRAQLKCSVKFKMAAKGIKVYRVSSSYGSSQASYIKPTGFFPTCHIVRILTNCTMTRAVDERTFVCIEEAPSLWPPGTVCQCGT